MDRELVIQGWQFLLGLATLLIVQGGVLYIAIKKYPKEKDVLDSDASKTYMEAAQGEAEYSLTLQNRIARLSEEIARYHEEDLKLRRTVTELENENLRKDARIAEQERRIAEQEKRIVALESLIKPKPACE